MTWPQGPTRPDLPLHPVPGAGQWLTVEGQPGHFAWCEHKKQPSSLRAALNPWGKEQSILHDVTVLKTA